MNSFRSVVLVVASFLAAGCAGAELDSESAVDQVAPPQAAHRAPAEIQKTVRANFDGIRQCYEAALTRDAALSGKIDLAFTIDRDGSTVDPRFGAASTLVEEGLQACVIDLARGFQFEEADGTTKISYPIVMTPS